MQYTSVPACHFFFIIALELISTLLRGKIETIKSRDLLHIYHSTCVGLANLFYGQ